MSKRVEVLYNYIKVNIPGWKHIEKISDDSFFMHYNVNALHTLDIIIDNVSENDKVLNSCCKYPNMKAYTYTTIIKPDDPFNGRKIYGEEFSGELQELVQKEMVRLHFNGISLDEYTDIVYTIEQLNQ